LDKGIIALLLAPFCECLVLVGIHSYLGIHVIRRGVVFIDLALAQIAALGTLIAFLFGIPPHTTGAYCFSLGLTAFAAAIFALCRFRRREIPQEAIIGLVYAIAAATAILLIDKAPHGAEHLKEIMTGSILWVKWRAIITAAVVYSGVGLFHYIFRRKFILISMEPEKAWEMGLNVRFWDFMFYLSFGLVITLSVDTAGVLIVFVFLVAPAIIALSLTDRWLYQLIIGWTLGVIVTTVGIALSYVCDLPTGPSVVGTYAIALIIMSVLLYNLKAENRLLALRNTFLAAAVLGAMLAGLLGFGYLAGKRVHTHAEHRAEETRAASTPMDVEKVTDAATLKKMFQGADDPEERTKVILRACEIDPAVGVSMALEFLRNEPPVFFRYSVVERLNSMLGGEAALNPDEPLSSEGNKRAVAALKKKYGLP